MPGVYGCQLSPQDCVDELLLTSGVDEDCVIVRPGARWTTVTAPNVESGSCLDPSVYTHSSGLHAGYQGTSGTEGGVA